MGSFLSCALSSDGNTLAIGDPDDNKTTIYTRSAGVWTQEGPFLSGSGAVGSASQGTSVSLSSDGNTLAVSGKNDNGSIGAVWIFTRSAGVWTQQGSKLVGTGAIGTSVQGTSLSLSSDGNILAVGGEGDNSSIGAVWIFTRSAGVWTQQGQKLVGTSGTGDQRQGVSVSLNSLGTVLAVGGYQNNSNMGGVWIFTYSLGVWSQQGGLLYPANTTFAGPFIGTGYTGVPSFGSGVAFNSVGDTLAVGGCNNNTNIGATWVFRSTYY